MKRLTPYLIALALALPLGVPGAATAERAAADLEAELDPASAALGGGFSRSGKLHSGGLGEGQTVRFGYLLEGGGCYRFLAVSGERARDLDLRVYTGETLLAADTGAVPRPVAQYCAKKEVRVEVRLQMFAGNGQYAFGVYSRDGEAQNLSSNTGEEMGVIHALGEAAEQLAPGSMRVGDVYTDHLGHRAATTVDVLLDLPSCYKFIAVGGDGVTDLSLSVTKGGQEVGSDRISGKRPVVQWCAPDLSKVKVKVAMYGGSGPFALGIYRAKATGTRATEKVGGPGSDFVANRIRQLHTQFGKGRAAISPAFRGNLSMNGTQVFKARLQAGRCYTVIAAGAPSVRDLEVTLLDRGGREVQSDKSANNFPVFDTDPCPSSTGQYTLRVKMKSGYGQFGLQVFSE